MRYINRRFTYLLTYLLTVRATAVGQMSVNLTVVTYFTRA